MRTALITARSRSVRTVLIAAALAVTLTLASACSTKRGALKGVGVGFGIATLGGLMTANGILSEDSHYGDSHFGDSEANLIGVGFIGIGGVYALGALINLAIVAHYDAFWRPPPPTQPEPPPRVDPPEAGAVVLTDAQVLTNEARAAARHGDCETVRKLDPQVLALDVEFHASVFLADIGIKHCRAAAVTTPPTPMLRMRVPTARTPPAAPDPAPQPPPPVAPVQP